MVLAKTGPMITDIRGGMGGVYFHRDNAGLHVARKPRVIHRRSPAQDLQRKAFAAARALSTDNRIVSYLMYRYMNDLNINFPDAWTLPTSYVDEDGFWSGESNLFVVSSPKCSSYAEIVVGDALHHYLQLSIRECLCDGVRFWANSEHSSGRQANVDIYYSGTWHEIYSRIMYPRNQWVQINFPRRNISATRIDLWHGAGGWRRLCELSFHTLNNPANNEPHVPVPADYEIPRL